MFSQLVGSVIKVSVTKPYKQIQNDIKDLPGRLEHYCESLSYIPLCSLRASPRIPDFFWRDGFHRATLKAMRRDKTRELSVRFRFKVFFSWMKLPAQAEIFPDLTKKDSFFIFQMLASLHCAFWDCLEQSSLELAARFRHSSKNGSRFVHPCMKDSVVDGSQGLTLSLYRLRSSWTLL